MDNVEELREALFELNEQRNRDLAQLAQSQAVLAGLEKVTLAASPSLALDALLSSVLESTQCDAALLLECIESDCQVIASSDAEIDDCTSIQTEFIQKRSLRIVDFKAVDTQVGALSKSGHYNSMISAPVEISPGKTLVLVCLCEKKSRFTSQHLSIAEQLITLASQTLATKRLADENSLLAAVLNRSSASFSIADADDPERKLIYVNEAFEKLTGYSRSEALGKNCRFLSAEDPNAAIRQSLRDTISERTIGHFEVKNIRKTGEEFWNNLSIFPVDAGGKSYTVATQWDLTERVTAEAERDMARQHLVSALASVKEGILLLDPENKVVFVNTRYQAFHNLGDTPLEHGQDFTTAWTNVRISQGYSQSEAMKDASQVLEMLQTPSAQREKTMSSGFQVLETNAKTSVGGIVSVLSDVTALKVAQHQLSDRIAAIDAVQDGIAITDPAGRIIYLNPSHMEMFGHSNLNGLIGRKWTVLYDADQMRFLEDVAIPAMISSGQWRGDVIGKRQDGEKIAHEVSLTQLEGSGLICVTRDISERMHAETERAALREQLHTAQRQEAIGQMAAGLAHDFNNCLSVVSGSATLVLETRSEADRNQHAQRILDASARAAELTGRLLTFGGRNSKPTALDLRIPLRSALDLTRSSLPSGIELRLDLPRHPLICEVDPTDVLQVVMNLVINARDAIDGSGTIGVGLEEMDGAKLVARDLIGEIAPEKRYAAVHVHDNGTGISEQDFTTLFDAYMTTKSDQGGTGLGLSVVRSLVQANGGAIEVSSQKNSGTRFTIFWPVEFSDRIQDVQIAVDEPTCNLQNIKVIIVDDDHHVSETIATFLENTGCEVVACDDPAEAIAVVEDDPDYWDIIITDYDMPGMTGAELAKKLRKIDEKLPIVLVTAVPEFMGSTRAGSKLFDARLAKPIDAKRLIAEIGRIVGK